MAYQQFTNMEQRQAFIVLYCQQGCFLVNPNSCFATFFNDITHTSLVANCPLLSLAFLCHLWFFLSTLPCWHFLGLPMPIGLEGVICSDCQQKLAPGEESHSMVILWNNWVNIYSNWEAWQIMMGMIDVRHQMKNHFGMIYLALYELILELIFWVPEKDISLPFNCTNLE